MGGRKRGEREREVPRSAIRSFNENKAHLCTCAELHPPTSTCSSFSLSLSLSLSLKHILLVLSLCFTVSATFSFSHTLASNHFYLMNLITFSQLCFTNSSVYGYVYLSHFISPLHLSLLLQTLFTIPLFGVLDHSVTLASSSSLSSFINQPSNQLSRQKPRAVF